MKSGLNIAGCFQRNCVGGKFHFIIAMSRAMQEPIMVDNDKK